MSVIRGGRDRAWPHRRAAAACLLAATSIAAPAAATPAAAVSTAAASTAAVAASAAAMGAAAVSAAAVRRATPTQPSFSPADPQAEALLAEGRDHADHDRRTAARAAFERALARFEAAGDRQGAARTRVADGVNRHALGEQDEGLRQVRQAIDTLKTYGGGLPLAEAYRSLMGIMPRGPEKDALREEALTVARTAGARNEECGLLFSLPVDRHRGGVYVDASRAAHDALACYRQVPGEGRRGRVLNLLGLIDGDHGQFHRARASFQEGLEFNERAGDVQGTISSLSGLAAVAGALFEPNVMRANIERALAIAREMNAETLTPALGGQLGAFFVAEREFALAKPLLDEALARETNRIRRVGFLQLSCRTETALDRFTEAARACDEAVALAKREGANLMMDALRWRAEMRRARGDVTGAAQDLAEGIVMAEEARSRSMPLDFMKRGFSEWQQELFTSSIALSMQTGDVRRALETAERARARSFLDLLATRDRRADDRGKERPAATAAGMTTAMPAGSGAVSPPGAASPQPATRITATGSTRREQPASSEAGPKRAGSSPAAAARDAAKSTLANDVVGVPEDLESSRTVDAPRIAEMAATARRLGSTLLVYWVSPDATFVWVVTPSGEVHARKVDVTQKDLVRIVREARAPAEGEAAGALALMPSQLRPWRELHDRLIAPVQAFLPRTDDALLTIVPHGPLFQVSFAGLRDSQGRYLIERYRLHYAPAVGVLEYTARHSQARALAGVQTPTTGRGGALLVGDPGELPSGVADAPPLPALPWARREVESIALLLSADGSGPTLLVGEAATESAVRASLQNRSVLHFATRGVVESSESLSSFLALRGGGADPASDGRLTADEVYGLRLNADLVVLSACGSGLGPTMTGDGVIGFTRAFLYARASSVVATQWSVPDVTSYEVMNRFYRERASGRRTADALRRAQLDTLAALRRGALRVDTPTSSVALGEHPVLWASFVLAGEP